MTNIFVYNIITLHTSKAKNYYLICQILSFLFEPASYCITFYVFYTIIHVFTERVFRTSMPKWKAQMLKVTKYVHWAIVGIFAGLVVVSWSWFILWRNYLVFEEIIFARKKQVWNKIDSARCILFWLAAWEVVGWGFYLGLMTSRDPSQVKFKVSIILDTTGVLVRSGVDTIIIDVSLFPHCGKRLFPCH